MNRLRLFPICLAVLLLGFASCAEDKGNYDYRQINEITITGLPETKMVVTAGKPVSILPQIASTQPGHEADYEYEWTYVQVATLVGSTFPVSGVFSREKELKDYLFGFPPNTYIIYYSVKDKNTGVKFQDHFQILIQTTIYEGFLVMNDIDGKMRLDMLSYNSGTGMYTQMTDVLTTVVSGLPEQQGPRQVVCDYDLNSPGGYSIFLICQTSTSLIHSETFMYQPSYDLSFRVMGAVPAGFTAQSITYTSTGAALMCAGNNAYVYHRSMGVIWGVPINTLDGGNTLFKVNPKISGFVANGVYILFNEENQTFYRAGMSNGTLSKMPVINGFEFTFPNTELLYNRYVQGVPNVYYSVLRDKSTGKCRLLRYKHDATLGDNNYNEEIENAPGIEQATLFSASTEFINYLFYSVGGKLYEYNTAEKQARLMVDVSPKEITLLQMPYYGPVKYSNLFNKLMVGIYDPSTKQGELRHYIVPPVNDPLIQDQNLSWSGFGKIVSATYRTR